jgi:pyruvate/2-oxoacid:ferredoxin oxidoreductase beta subunit
MSAPQVTSPNPFDSGARDPWCPGCGHTLLIRALQKALAAGFDPHDVVLVTDIGCIGMADGLFRCHTVHGLHGRAPALAAGIAMTLPRPGMKVVVLMGDGGAAIGLQHVLECARLNVDLTLVVSNNQNYGMTGGQQSAYTLPGVRTTTSPGGAVLDAFDLARMLEPFGVPRVRVPATDRDALGEALARSLDHRGFSYLEVLTWCPSYAGKLNPDSVTPRDLSALFEARGQPTGVWPGGEARPVMRFEGAPRPRSAEPLPVTSAHRLEGVVHLLVAGSAGKGVQSAAEVFARAAVRAGLHVALRSEYPVTVGKGFSASQLCLSARPLGSPVAEHWDLALVCSPEGWAYVRERQAGIRRLVLDASLADGAPGGGPVPVDPTAVGAVPHTVTRLWLAAPRELGYRPANPEAGEEPQRGARTARPPALVERADFVKGDARGAAFAALAWALKEQGWFDLDALRAEVERVSHEGQRRSLLAALE